MKQALDIFFPTPLIKEPIICQMARKFDVVFNIRRAKITEKEGEIVLELEGSNPVVEGAIAWLKAQGLNVGPITKDTIES